VDVLVDVVLIRYSCSAEVITPSDDAVI